MIQTFHTTHGTATHVPSKSRDLVALEYSAPVVNRHRVTPGGPHLADDDGSDNEVENGSIKFIDEGIDRTSEVYAAPSSVSPVSGSGAALTPIPVGAVGTPQQRGAKRSRRGSNREAVELGQVDQRDPLAAVLSVRASSVADLVRESGARASMGSPNSDENVDELGAVARLPPPLR